jgi:D-serine deaminase-like pyridoxal phosphate-dependent protein
MKFNGHRVLLEDLPTPSLLLDLDILESNIQFMQDRANTLGVRMRPHVKTHKCLEIGELQRSAGATGITVATIEEAFAFANAGFDDILWAFPMIPSRLSDVLQLSRQIEFGVAVESEATLELLSTTGEALSVWIEIDCGYGRSGVPYESEILVHLAQKIIAAGLKLKGCFTHGGHTYKADSSRQIIDWAEHTRCAMVAAGDRLRTTGIEPGSLSVGSTPEMSIVENLEGIDEARPGNYSLFDYSQIQLGSCGVERCAVTVLSTVVSANATRAKSIADCGALVLSKDLGPDTPPHYGRVFEDLSGERLHPDIRVSSVSQEHGTLTANYPVGTKIRILPNHSCLTVAQFDHFQVIRGNDVLDRWRIRRARDLEAVGTSRSLRASE